jgi:alkylated DNA repair protein alkB family protein 1
VATAKAWQFCDRREACGQLSKVVPAELLFRKLRWATLGLQFDWSKRAYDESLPYSMLPTDLAQLAARLAEAAVTEGEFKAEAAIVNYYGPDDMLGGHVDDMEADWSKPIVSISLGCKAVFLLGGTSREESPTAMFVRSGDVVLMAGPARRCFHGVPRIFVDSNQSEVPDFAALVESQKGSSNLDAVVQYINQSRINVNIRQVH